MDAWNPKYRQSFAFLFFGSGISMYGVLLSIPSRSKAALETNASAEFSWGHSTGIGRTLTMSSQLAACCVHFNSTLLKKPSVTEVGLETEMKSNFNIYSCWKYQDKNSWYLSTEN